ncbi:MAG: NAD(P)-binding domain-containing protein, partial [Syntrophomonadaceae bacterium]|nr:NAD(P)-binding domain-containing protein [Syntrophomonadaceae bacterium]
MKKVVERVAVLGAGSWGTALAVLLANKGLSVRLWGRLEDGVQEMQKSRENRFFLPEVRLPEGLEVTEDKDQVMMDADAVVFAVPAQAVREVVRRFRSFLQPGRILINTAKGIETQSLLRLSQVLKQELPREFWPCISVLSGPSHAEEVARDLPTAVVAAADSQAVAEAVQDLFMTPRFRVYANLDVVGVELGAALKNVIALSTG